MHDNPEILTAPWYLVIDGYKYQQNLAALVTCLSSDSRVAKDDKVTRLRHLAQCYTKAKEASCHLRVSLRHIGSSQVGSFGRPHAILTASGCYRRTGSG